MNSDRSLRSLMDFAAATAYTAGRMTLGYYATGVRPDYKSDDSPVTVADRLSEEFIRREIEARYPAHAIVGEEYGVKETAGATHRWLIDPIDGTRSFIRGVPLYAVLLGLEIDGAPAVGAAYYPATDELLVAATGEGCYWNGKPARVSTVSDLSRAYVSCSDFGNFEVYGGFDAWMRLVRKSYARVGWTDAFGYLLVATGRLEVMLDPIVNPWDCGPFVPILQEAGGYFGDWNGHPTNYGGRALATNAALRDRVLRLLAGEEE
ncbi:MAG: histidinol phosphate phosphatase [Anaerolineae bacterium]|jgi:myo-inositol-1(or 4)-monophosphatase|nr:histidinol phosphate phosphatase [Anaerolineae bacterium]